MTAEFKVRVMIPKIEPALLQLAGDRLAALPTNAAREGLLARMISVQLDDYGVGCIVELNPVVLLS